MDTRIAEWLFLLAFVSYGYFYAGAGWNQNANFDLTRAIVERHTFAIDAYASNTGDVSYANGHTYANKAPALSFLAAIPYAFLYAAGVRDVTLACYLCTLLTCGVLGALVPAMLYLVARRRGVDAPWAATLALIIAFGTELFPYSTILMVAVPSGSLMLMALISRRTWLGGFCAALAAAMNYVCAIALLVILVARSVAAGAPPAARRAGARAATQFLAGALPVLLGLMAYQYVCFGGFFTNAVATTDPRFLSKGALFGWPSLTALYGVTLSPYRGLFFFAPVLLVALVPLIRHRALLAISVVFLLVNICFINWDAGFALGARYLVPLIPLWGLALIGARPRRLVIVLATLSFAINLTATAVDPQPSASIPRPLTQYLVPLLVRGHFSPDVPITKPWSARTFTGHTSVNRLVHDEAVVFSRHPPGSNESEWSSFNLGEPFFGPGDSRSLIPFAVFFAIGVAAILAKARRASALS